LAGLTRYWQILLYFISHYCCFWLSF
jgi:hypothetical protein